MIERLICNNVCVVCSDSDRYLQREASCYDTYQSFSKVQSRELTAPLHVTEALSSSVDKAAVTLIDTSDFRV